MVNWLVDIHIFDAKLKDGGKDSVITPFDAFIKWFDQIPIPLRRYIAHVFRVCTTDDTSQMLTLPDQSLDGFRNWAVKVDFPIRIAARMFYIRSIFDMVIFHYREIVADEDFFGLPSEKNNIVNLSSKQWEELLESWKNLRAKEMSDTYIHSWASWMIKPKKEEK
jgi:hypothetical protein